MNNNDNQKQKKSTDTNALGKKGILPTLILILVSFIILTICGISYCGSMLDILRNYKNNDYNRMAETHIQDLNNFIENECLAIQNYSDDISKSSFQTLDRNLIVTSLQGMATYNGYSNMYVLDSTGNGFDCYNNSVNLSSMEYFKSINSSEQSIVAYDDYILYITPVIDSDNQFKFYIIAENSVKDGFDKITTEDWNNLGYYILDGENNVIAYNNVENPLDDYQQIIDEGVLYSSTDTTITSITDITPSRFFKSIANVFTAKNTSTEIWYQNPISINDWTILMGRTATEDGDIMNMLSLSMYMLALMVFTFVIILIIFMILNAINAYKMKKVFYTDAITGGNNWLKFKHDASIELKKGKNRYALVSFDIYQFRLFCDINGHKKGNEALIEIDGLIKSFVKRKEYYAHNNSDTFDMFLLYENDQLLVERLKRFSEILGKSPKLNGMRFAFGVYVVDNKNISLNRMSTMANMSKDNSRLKDYNLRETISFFTKQMHDTIIKEKEILNSFDDALKNEEFLLFVQPKYDLMSETLSAGEALVRWQKSDGTFISPIEFIPAFEKNGCVSDLDRYMLEAVCKKQRQWLDEGLNVVPISVNLSRACFSDKNLAKAIVRLVDSYKLPHNIIELEVTESAFFDNPHLLIDTVQKLREFGFSVSIDDFGAGYSSLNSLKELPIDIIKIDGGFFRGIASKDVEKSNIIVKNTIRLANELDFKVVAEGVETEEQIQFLRSLGYDMLIQSYYYSKPIPNQDFKGLLQS